MSYKSYQPPSAQKDLKWGLLAGSLFSVLLFIGMAIAQMQNKPDKPEPEVEPIVIALEAPELEDFEEEEEPEVEEEEPEIELESAPPELSLDQLDLALNPGTGGDIVGDFSLPGFDDVSEAGSIEDVFDFEDLDSVPRRLSGTKPDYPRELRSKRIGGVVKVKVTLLPDGSVSNPEILASPHPKLSQAVLKAVCDWMFEKPRVNGRNVQAAGTITLPFNIK